MSLLPKLVGGGCEGCEKACSTSGRVVRVGLIGQPNCGKSTLFNAVAGYRSATGNYSGTTVRLTWGRVRVNGSEIVLIDVPGIYSLSASSPTEKAAKRFLLQREVDVIVNVMDASLLRRSLELTLELQELGVPMVVSLNMIDEARRKGMAISLPQLSEKLRVPVVETIATRGVGVHDLFSRVISRPTLLPGPAPSSSWTADTERAIARLERGIAQGAGFPPGARFLAVKLLERDEDLLEQAGPEARALAGQVREEFARTHGHALDDGIVQERRERAAALAQETATAGRPHADFRETLDDLLTHPFWGYVFLVLVLAGLFWAVFGIGGWTEKALLGALGAAFVPVTAGLGHHTLAYALASSLWDGFVGGAAIVLPYLVPFLFGLALLEDTGYLPRIAYLLDGLCHRIGLHGTSVVPVVLGYGCSVPACLATRALPSRRDRFLATVLATLVPCSARSTVIFALAAFYLGPAWALTIFAFNALVVLASGWLLARLWPEVSMGMILEVPRYEWPSPRMTARKVWLRLREFVVVSWPLLIGGSALLGLADYWHGDRFLNAALSPLTGVLGLPSTVGVTLIFGVLRKELTMVMLVQALGTTNLHAVLTTAQILTFTVFVTFYVPCLASLAAMTKEIGRKLTTLAAAYSFALATLLGVGARFLLTALHLG